MEKTVDTIQQCTDTDDFAEQNNSTGESKSKFIENLQSNHSIIPSSSCTLKNCDMHSNNKGQESLPGHVNLEVPMEESPLEISNNCNKTEISLINFFPRLTSENQSKLSIKQENLRDSEMCISAVTIEEASILRNNSNQNSEKNCKNLENISCVVSNIQKAICGSKNKEIQSPTDGNKTHRCSTCSENNTEQGSSEIYNSSLASSMSETIINPSYNYSRIETEATEKESADFNEFDSNFSSSNSWNNCSSHDVPLQSITANKQFQDPECSFSTNLVSRCIPEKSLELKRNAQTNSIELSGHSVKRRSLNLSFNKDDVIECLEYINSAYHSRNAYKLFNLYKSKIARKSEYITGKIQQTVNNRTAEKSENYTDTKSRVKVPANSLCSPQKYAGMDKIASAIHSQLSVNCLNSSVSSEENTTNSSIKSKKRINNSESAPVVCPDFAFENISSNLVSSREDQNEISCEQLRNIVSSALKLPEECNLNSPQSSAVKTLTSAAVASPLNASFLSSSDHFSKLSATRHVESNLIVNDAERRSKSTEVIDIHSDSSESSESPVQCIEIISEYPAPLNSVSHQSKTYEHSESRKREPEGMVEKTETFKKVKTENIRDVCGDLNIQLVAGKESQDVQKKMERKYQTFFPISSPDLEKPQITSPNIMNVIFNRNDNAENISLLFGANDGRNKVPNSYSNAASSYNTRSTFEEPIVSDKSDKLKTTSGLQPDCGLRTQIGSNIKRKLSPEDYMNLLAGNRENVPLTPKKYFKTEPTQILVDPCPKENVIRFPCAKKDISAKIESVKLPSTSTLIRPHIPTTETTTLKNKMYITVSRNTTSPSFSTRTVTCIPRTPCNPNSCFNANGNKGASLSLPRIFAEQPQKLVHCMSLSKPPASALVRSQTFALENSNKTIIVNSSKDQASTSTNSDNSQVLPTHIYPSLHNAIPHVSQSAVSPGTFRISPSTLLDHKGLLHFKEKIHLGQQSIGESPKQTSYELAHYSEEMPCLNIFTGRRGNAALTKKLHKNLGTKFVPTNEVLFLLLEWNGCWLQQQKETKLCPPICDKYSEVKDNYESVNEYYNIYFPLYLLSIWLKIYDSWEVCFNATYYTVRFESCEEKPNYVKIICSCTLTNTELNDFPTAEGIILVTFVKCDGKEEKLFGYMFSLTDDTPPPLCNQAPSSKIDFKKISISFYVAEKLNIATKEYITVQKLCNIRVPLKQNDALVSLKSSEMKDLVLRPKNHASEISIIALPGNHDIKEMFSRINEIINCIMSPAKKITLVETPPSVDRVCVIVEMVRKLKENKCTVLICLKQREIFVRLAGLLINESYKPVIAVKASEIKMPERLKKFTLRELTEAIISDDCTPERASFEVLKNCNVILTVLSCIYFFEVGTAFPASNLTCIIDDANLFPETETILPLSYNLKNLVLFGDVRKQVELHPLLQKYGYNKSFYNRLHKVKSIL